MPMLELSDIHTYYGESYVIQGISLQVMKGSVVALLGRNGMGKTTTIRAVMGFTPARRGTIYFKDIDITKLKRYQIARLGIGLVPQGRRIFPSLSVKENLKIAARGADKPDGWSLDRVYSFFPILKERANLKGNLLSGGEQQMLTFSRALMTNADLLLMDEPSEGLSPAVVHAVGRTITMLKGERPVYLAGGAEHPHGPIRSGLRVCHQQGQDCVRVNTTGVGSE